MKTINLYLAISLMVTTLLVGLSFGYYISPNLTQEMNQEMDLGQADRFVDLRYINQMAAHHKGAILLAGQIENKTDRGEIKELAKNIKQGEPKLIDELYQWKKNWYGNSQQVSDPIVPNLGKKDKNIDLRFLNALISHHESGIRMTKEIRTKSSRSEVLDNANAVEDFLTKSLVVLKDWRQDWYKVN